MRIEALVAAGALWLVAVAAHAELPGISVAAIAVRALGYDNGLIARAGGRVDLLVLSSTTEQAGAQLAFAALDGVKVQGLPLAVAVAAPSADELTGLLDQKGPEAVFVDGRDNLVRPLAELAKVRGFLLLVKDRALLEQGAHLAITDAGGKPRLVVSAAGIKAARVVLGAELLKLAEVVR